MLDYLKKSAVGILLLGVVLVGFVLVTTGVSTVAPLRFNDSVEAEAFYNEQGGLYKPFCVFEFKTVASSELYMFIDESKPTDWIFYGDMGDRALPFTVRAASDATSEVFPDTMYNVEYILRYPSDNKQYIDDVLKALEDHAVSGGMTSAEYYTFSANALFEAARNVQILYLAVAGAGLLLMVVGVAGLLVKPPVRRKPGYSGVDKSFDDGRTDDFDL